MGWRNILMGEHRVVLEVVDVAHDEVERMQQTGEARTDLLTSILEFFRYFNDGLHDPKEEDLLFARCHRRGMSCEEGTLARLISDHDACREQMDSMRESFRGLKKGEVTPAAFAEKLSQYVDLVRGHIAYEETEFFDMAQTYLTEEDRKELTDEFDSAHYDEVEEGVLEHFEMLGHQLSHHEQDLSLRWTD